MLILIFLMISPIISSEKAIYTVDSRQEYYQLDSETKRQARSVAIQVPKKNLFMIFNTWYPKWHSLSTLAKSEKLCSGEAFSKQRVLGDCTAFVVGHKQLLTARHCVPDIKACRDHYWVFDYALKKNKVEKPSFTRREVFECRRILKQGEGVDDYTLLELKHRPKCPPLEFSSSEERELATDVYMLGYPSGIAVKKATGKIFLRREKYLVSTLDSFGGNSGSPVFDKKSKKVVGILVAGSRDYDFDGQKGCYRAYQCDINTCPGEYALKVNDQMREF